MYISITPTLIELNDAFRRVVGLDPFFITATSSHCAHCVILIDFLDLLKSVIIAYILDTFTSSDH